MLTGLAVLCYLLTMLLEAVKTRVGFSIKSRMSPKLDVFTLNKDTIKKTLFQGEKRVF